MLYIAEKPELARAIVDALGGGKKCRGYYECGDDRVTWCFGHMLELYEPKDFDPALKYWKMEDLPLFFFPWKKRPIAGSKEQFAVIVDLLREAETVVHAGDPDAEGQLLIDEVLRYVDYQGPVKRLLINDNTPALVKKALSAMRDNAEFKGLSASAEARQIADALYGYNMTRLYTLAARLEGVPDILSVGRVQTPILGLVVRRDREHEAHEKTAYYVVKGDFRSGDSCFTAVYQNSPGDPQDGEGRLSHCAHAKALADSLAGKPGTVVSFEVKTGETPPPLPYNLLKLQADASRLLGLAPDEVKEITQTLREKHRLITYNRSDCQFLSDEQHADAPEVIAAIAANVRELASVPALDVSLKSRAFDSSKVSAHHAIIPTRSRADFSKLTENERSVYRLIARAYLVQFLPNHVWEKATATIAVDDRTFVGHFRNTVSEGWRAFHKPEAEDDEAESSIVRIVPGQEIICASCECLRKETAPKPLYTMAGLLNDLTRVSQYVRDESLRKVLIDKDREKEGEHGGIGTPATRDEILKTLIERGYIEIVKKGKSLIVASTRTGRDFYDILPDDAKYPDLTAQWHQQQIGIERGDVTVDAFLDGILSYLGKEVARVIENGLGIRGETHACPKCGKAMLRRPGKTGHFWSCSGFPECASTLPDRNGNPVSEPGRSEADTAMICPDCGKPMRYIAHAKGDFHGCTGYPGCRRVVRAKDGKPGAGKAQPRASARHTCLVCGKALVRRPGKEDGQFFWGCSDFPKCRNTYPDHDGKPKYGKEKGKTKDA
jgi:DNA topoisomerase-3